MDIELLEHAIQKKLAWKLEHLHEVVKIHPAKRVNPHAPKTIRALQLDVEKARQCAMSGNWPSSLDEIEELEESIHLLEAEQSVFGVADIEEGNFEMIERALHRIHEALVNENPNVPSAYNKTLAFNLA